MIDITDRNHQPSIKEISDCIGNPLFHKLYGHMRDGMDALYSVDYSGDRLLLGWNIRFYKGGRTLCRLYPKKGYFSVLVVIGRKEKARVEAELTQMCGVMRDIYESTKEGMGQRWLLIDLHTEDALFQDVQRLVSIRRESR